MNLNEKPITTKKKPRYILYILIIVIVLIGAMLVSVLNRPNLQMDDFNTNNGVFGTVLLLGFPSRTEPVIETSNDIKEWEYDNCIKFYGIDVAYCKYNFTEHKYHLMFDSNHIDDIEDVLNEHCEYKSYLSHVKMSEYSYKNKTIQFFETSGYCSVIVLEE